MSCNRCGTATPRAGLCKECAMIERVEESHDREQHDCPRCGGATSGSGVKCADCRRGGR